MSQIDASLSSSNVLPDELVAELDKFRDWSLKDLNAGQENDKISGTLYQYTNMAGLKGMFESKQVWFTDYRHLNDPSELIHGIDMAHAAIDQLSTGEIDERSLFFLARVKNLLRLDNFNLTLGFYVACFSRARDDLGQWRAYGDNGKGAAIGFSPSVFKVTPAPSSGTLPEFVGLVRYALDEVGERHARSIEEAAIIFRDAAGTYPTLISNPTADTQFATMLAEELIAAQLIWNCLTSKHPAYSNEQEVRLAIMGTTQVLEPHVRTRFRGSEIVPYIPQPQPMPEKIAEIVVGPAAPFDAERTVRTMLRSLGVTQDIPISRSDIPYRS